MGNLHGMRYRVGQRVRVRPDIMAYHSYKQLSGNKAGHHVYTAQHMADLRGKIVTIKAIRDDLYMIEPPIGNFVWADEHFVPVSIYTLNNIKENNNASEPAFQF